MESKSYRLDPLYRVVDEPKLLRKLEGKFKDRFDRLKWINNLGIIPEVIEMAKFPKYEHTIGTLYQTQGLLKTVKKEIIPEKYRQPLLCSAILMHLGHFPFTFTAERALILACNLGDRNKENKIKTTVKKTFSRVCEYLEDEELKKRSIKNILSQKEYMRLHKFFTAEFIIERKNSIVGTCDLDEDDLKIIVKNLVKSNSDGFKYLSLANKADFVQRDALYFGSAQIDISPKQLYDSINKAEIDDLFEVDEQILIDKNLEYLDERFYSSDEVIAFSRLLEKIIASLILSDNFKLDYLKKYSDEEFKRLITHGKDKKNNSIQLPRSWRNKAEELFQKDTSSYDFSKVFSLSSIIIPNEIDAIDLEYDLIDKNYSKRGLLTYPFRKGILVDINNSENQQNNQFKVPNHRYGELKLFQNDCNKQLLPILKLIERLPKYRALFHLGEIKEGIGQMLSWTGKVRVDNDSIIKALSYSLKKIDKNYRAKFDKSFIVEFLESIRNIKTYNSFWKHPFNQIHWYLHLANSAKNNDKLDIKTYQWFCYGLLDLPLDLLQFKSVSKYIDEIIDQIKKDLSNDLDNDFKGELFEAQCLLREMIDSGNNFTLLLNGLVVIDPSKPRREQDENEFDVIKIIVDDNNEIECKITACSIANNIAQNNEEQLRTLVDYIHDSYPDIRVRSKYCQPDENWQLSFEDAGRNYN